MPPFFTFLSNSSTQLAYGAYHPPKFFQTTGHVLLVLKVISFRARGDGLDIIAVNGCGRSLTNGGLPAGPTLALTFCAARQCQDILGRQKGEEKEEASMEGALQAPALTRAQAERGSGYSEGKIGCWMEENEAGRQGKAARKESSNSNYSEGPEVRRTSLHSDSESDRAGEVAR